VPGAEIRSLTKAELGHVRIVRRPRVEDPGIRVVLGRQIPQIDAYDVAVWREISNVEEPFGI